MPEASWLQTASPALRLTIATSWLAPANWQEHQEGAIREAVGAGVDWMEYIRLVDRHRTPALSWAALKRVRGLELPDHARQQLQKRSETCRMQAIKQCIQLEAVLKGFNRDGILAMPLKGPILSSALYGDLGLRQSKDLDLAVTLEDLRKAQACLEKMGWRQESTWFPLSPRQWERLLEHEKHLTFIHSHGAGLLELHWREPWDAPGKSASRWARSTRSVWQGCSHQAMDPVDMAIYLCSHGAGHTWFRAKWLGDLARIHATGGVDWGTAICEARRSGQERALLASLRLLEQLYALQLPGLAGDPWKNLPYLLVEMPLHALQAEEHVMSASFASLRHWIHISRYEGQLLPRTTWRSRLSVPLYRREDMRILDLPDGLVWAYSFLRPIFWLCRLMRHGPRQN